MLCRRVWPRDIYTPKLWEGFVTYLPLTGTFFSLCCLQTEAAAGSFLQLRSFYTTYRRTRTQNTSLKTSFLTGADATILGFLSLFFIFQFLCCFFCSFSAAGLELNILTATGECCRVNISVSPPLIMSQPAGKKIIANWAGSTQGHEGVSRQSGRLWESSKTAPESS